MGGWLCFGLGALVMYWSVWTFILYIPLFFVAFVLSIVAMAQRRIALGLVLLLATIIVPLIEWFTLAATRTSKFLDDHGPPKVNAQTPTVPLATSTSPSQAIVDATKQAVSKQGGSGARDDQPTRDRLSQEPIDKLHAWELAVGYKGFFAADPISAPTFSPDGESVIFAQQSGNAARAVIYGLQRHELLKSWQVTDVPTAFAWSPQGDKVAYKTQSGLHIVELSSAKDTPLPLHSFFGSPTDRFTWTAPQTLVCPTDAIRTLDLESLTVTQESVRTEEREHVLATIFGSPQDHPSCVIFQAQVGNSPYLFVGERDHSYSSVLLTNFFSQTPFYVSPDLRHILIYEGGSFVRNPSITHVMLSRRPAPERTFQIDLGIRDGGVHDGSATGPEKYLQLNVPFWADICSASVNPLNGKVVGPNPNDFKGRVRIIRWGNNLATVQVAMEIKPVKEGDIAFNISSEQWGQFGNWPWSFPNVWKVLKSATGSAQADIAQTDTAQTEAVGSAPAIQSKVPTVEENRAPTGPETAPERKANRFGMLEGKYVGKINSGPAIAKADPTHQNGGTAKHWSFIVIKADGFAFANPHEVYPNARGLAFGLKEMKYSYLLRGPIQPNGDGTFTFVWGNVELIAKIPSNLSDTDTGIDGVRENWRRASWVFRYDEGRLTQVASGDTWVLAK